jgi:hypothetical protein
MSTELVGALVGLALLDSINTSTLFLVMVLLLTARSPVRSSVAYAAGAAASFLGLALALYFGAAAAEATIADLARWLRRGSFVLLALWLLHLGYKRLRDRPRKPLLLPSWFGPVTAVPTGALATLADLPNAFPLFLAIERVLSAELTGSTAVLVLTGYVVLYAMPVAVVIVVGVCQGERARKAMARITARFTSGVARRSLPLTGVFTSAAACSLVVATLV